MPRGTGLRSYVSKHTRRGGLADSWIAWLVIGAPLELKGNLYVSTPIQSAQARMASATAHYLTPSTPPARADSSLAARQGSTLTCVPFGRVISIDPVLSSATRLI